jgi:hypothetical protein
MLENAPNQSSSLEKNRERKTFLGLLEKYPNLKQTAMMFAVLAGTISTSDRAEAEQTEESETQHTYREAATQTEHNQNISDFLAGLNSEEVASIVQEASALLNAKPESPEESEIHLYRSIDTTESISQGNESSSTFLSDDVGELPLKGGSVEFLSIKKSGIAEITRSGDHSTTTLWSGVSSYDVMTPAVVPLEAGGTMTRVGIGSSTTQALEAALRNAGYFLNTDISPQRMSSLQSKSVDSVDNFENDSRITTETDASSYSDKYLSKNESNANYYLLEWEVTNDEVMPSKWGGVDEHRVTVEITVGVPILE